MDFLLYLGKFLLLTVLSEYLRPKAQRDKPAAAGLKDINFPTADPTRPHQWLMGRRLIDNANLFGTFDFESSERTKSIRTGLIRRETVVTGHDYYVSAAMVLCGGTGAKLRRIWAGKDRLVWEGSLESGYTLPISIEWTEEGQTDAPRGFKGFLEFYSGPSAVTGQPVTSAYLLEKRGAGNVPAWKHLTYIVLRGTGPDSGTVVNSALAQTVLRALAYGSLSHHGMWIGTSTQVEQLRFEVERMPTAVSTGLGNNPEGVFWSVDGDANPAYALAEVLTDVHYGAGIAPEEIDAPSFHRAAKVLWTERHGTSQLWDSQRVSGEVVLELCRQIGGILQPDPLTGLHTLRLLRGTDEPVLVLNDDNIQRLAQFSQNSMDEATNSMALNYASRDEKFELRPVDVLDDAAIEIAGKVIPGTASYAGITNASLANIIATRDLRSVSSPLATARLSAIVPKRQRFLPGDAVVLSSVKNGIISLRMRVTSARYSKPGESLCELELVEDVFRSGEAIFSPPTAVAGTSPSAPSEAGWSDYTRLAPYPLTDTPQEPHMMFVAGAPLFNPERATGYRLGYFDDATTRDSTTVAWSETRTAFAARGTLAQPLAQLQTGAISMNVSTGDAYTISRNSGAEVMAYIGEELLRVSATVAGTVATVTILERGVYGTMPEASLAGQYLVLVYDKVIDPAPLVVGASEYGTDWVATARASRVRTQTIGRGGLGPFDTVSQVFDPTVPAGVNIRADLLDPYGPGNVLVDGTAPARCAQFGITPGGASTSTFPTLAGAALTFAGRNRLRTDTWQGYLTGTGLEPGATASVNVQSRPWPAAGDFVLHASLDATSGSCTLPTLPAGQRFVQASITIDSPTGGTRSWCWGWFKAA
jgi:hypothetical protein